MGGSGKTDITSKIDPQLMALYRQNYARASATDTPFKPYTGPITAPVKPVEPEPAY